VPADPVPVDVAPDRSPEMATPETGPAKPAEANLAWPRLFLTPKDVRDRDEAVRVGGLVVSEDEFQAAFAAAHEATGVTEADFRAEIRDELLLLGHLQESGLLADPQFEATTRADLRRVLSLLVLEHETNLMASVSEAEARAAYDARAAEYSTPATVSIRMILVPTAADADAALARILAGEAFAKVASEVSTHPSRAMGGEVPPFSRGTFNEALEDAAFSMPSGEIATVSTTRGTYLIQKVAESAARNVPFEEVRAAIVAELAGAKRERAREEFLVRLRRTAAD